jgi:hypothetical protein
MQEKSHKWVYITIAVVIVALMVAGVLLYHQEKQSKEAQAKAQEFVSALKAQGLPAPTVEAAARMFGTDGGAFAKNLGEDLQQAQYAWQLGTGGPASRAVILDDDFVKAADAFVRVYVKDRAAASDFIEWLHQLKTGETTN